jgi:two-component system cell cycle response regulator
MADSNPTYSVLLVGEDPKQTEMYSELLIEVAPCKIDVISRLESGFDWIGQGNYHLVVIDVPASSKPSALTLLEQIKRMRPTAGVILVSEQADVGEAVAAIRMGAEDYLKKPFNVEEFKLAAKRSLDRKTVFGVDNTASKFLSLLSACQMVSASLEQKKIFGIIQSYLSQELKCQHTAIYSLQGKDPIRIEAADREDRAMQEVLDIALRASAPLHQMEGAGEMYRFINRGQLTPALFIFRFKCAGQSDYFCICLSPEQPSPLEEFGERLRMLGTQIEVTGKNIEQYMGVQHLVYVDDATGLYNTRYLHNVLDREIQHSQSSGKPFAVLFIDADKFKSINDSNGHLVGTKLLYELGEQLKRFVRDTDTVFRYGGDEFIAVLSACDLSTAKAVAERIRQSVEKRSFLESEGLAIHFTVSIGVALFPEHAKSKKEIIDAADQAMYDAKKTSRNSVTVAKVLEPNSNG